jgi:hypothetical protein
MSDETQPEKDPIPPKLDPVDDDRPRKRRPRPLDDGEDEDDRPRGPRRRRRPEDDEDDDEYYRRRGANTDAGDFLLPTNVSGWSIAACYLGGVGCFLPLVGLAMALVALPCGIIALRQKKKQSTKGSYGSVTSDIRAIIGIIASSLVIVGHIVVFIILQQR